jgi:deazaflavin-dependent oxidoreductase (nitroreductase family)
MSEMHDFNQGVINEFRANNGKVGGGFAGAPIVLLTTTGARSGQTRTTPLVSLVQDDGTQYVFASAAGSPKNPDWYHNLVAQPQVQVEFGDETFTATAQPITGPERDKIFALQVERFPDFAAYEKKTTRTIPVVLLTRAEGSG